MLRCAQQGYNKQTNKQNRGYGIQLATSSTDTQQHWMVHHRCSRIIVLTRCELPYIGVELANEG
jgi:hypothetical protein